MIVQNATLALVGIVLAASSGVLAIVVAPSKPTLATGIHVSVMLVAAACGLTAASRVAFGAGDTLVSWPWAVPGGSFDLRIDAIAAVFLIQVFLIGALGSVYAVGYWPHQKHPETTARLRIFYGLVVAGMALLVVANNSIVFLVGWEIMAIAAFFALTVEDRDKGTRECGLVYLVATRLGTLGIVAMFALLYSATSSFRFPAASLDLRSPLGVGVVCLGLFGFGLKAGIMPLHVWLPGAHANAPTHVSALMSGVLIKMGIYGLIRMGGFFGNVVSSWGVILFALGATSAVLGVAFALGQHDLKRLLAYHSVENIGIIVMAMGIAWIGRATHRLDLVALGMGGALLHTFNHGLFKALLFYCAGAVIAGARTRELDRMGALARRLRFTNVFFLVGAIAICGLPPLNGFASELLVYMGMMRGGIFGTGALGTLLVIGIPLLAMVGALAVACFVKVHGVVFLGEARTEACSKAEESPTSMLTPMGLLAAACVTIGAFPILVVGVLERAVVAWFSSDYHATIGELVPYATFMRVHGLLLVAVVAVAWSSLRVSPMSRVVRAPTWDCGYTAPSPRMQYTASSTAEWLVSLFSFFLRPRKEYAEFAETFPKPRRFESHVPEVVLDLAVLPSLRWLLSTARWFRWIQPGRTHLYIVYILFALVVMLFVWR